MRNVFLIITILIVSFFSASLTAQTYSGPATGNVDAGAVVTTDDFLLIPIEEEPPAEPRIIDIEEPDFGPLYYNGNKDVFDNVVYVDDSNAYSRGGGEIGINFELHSFPSIPMGNSIPPDNHMAVGPNHVITTVNSRFHIYDREGNLLKNIDADAWTNAVLPNPGAFDPQIIYDHYSDRWFMLWDNQNSSNSTAFFLISYSDDSDPLGTWYMYAIDATTNGNANSNSWGDYPQIGYDDQAIYINSRQFSFSSGYQYNKIRIIKKSELYAANAGPLSWTDLWNIRRPNGNDALDVLQPAISYDPGINAAYFTWASFGVANFYVVYKITDPITNPVLTGVELPVPTYFQSPLANQLGGGSPRIETGGSKIRAATVLRDGKLYAAHGMRNSQFSGYGSIKYFVVDVNTNAVLEQVEQGAQGFFYFYPAIIVDQDHNLAITYSRSADTEYAGSYYSTKLGTDPPGLSPSKVMQEGQGNYVVTFGGSRNRWGDYLGAALDPSNQANIWLYSEYAAATNVWGTWLTEIRMKPYTGTSLFTAKNPVEFGDLEIGATSITKIITISNYGEDDLVINDITSPAGPFTLLTGLTYPVTLSTYDSLDLEIEFDPSTPAIYSELMAFDDNEAGFDGLILNGTGFEINTAFTGVFYSSTGLTENGKMLTVNKNNGVGTELGISNFEELHSLTINPVSNVVYGISTSGTETELVRVNALGGDAFTQYTLDLGSMVGIAFDSSGTLYGAVQGGDIYTIDLSDGSYSLVTTASIQLTAITFNPLTNQMWAVPRVVIGVKDKIYTIDLTTGDGTLVGQTGFGVLTNDLAFDENGIMYGVIGGATDVGQLITINTTDGTGTMVGDIGFQNVVGLAYTITGSVNSVDSDNDKGYIPEEYVLSQNYPNPFNPSTLIEFSVPVDASVTLTIFNLLGQVVSILVNDEISAGNYKANWNGRDREGTQVSSGIYLYEIKANGNNGSVFSQTKKMILLK